MSLRGVPHRGLLAALAGALLVTTIAWLIARSSGEHGDSVATAEAVETTTTSATTTTWHRLTTTTAAPAAPNPPPATTAAPPTTAAARAPRPTTTTTTTVPAPPFHAAVEAVTAEQLGASWTPGLGCTPPEELRAVVMTHWGDDGQVHQGRLIVAAVHVDAVVAAFRDVYAARFPIHQMVPVSEFGGDDEASMRANNTSAYNCRTVAGKSSLSQHAYGAAVDVNPLVNPYVKGGTVDPPEGAPYADRSRTDPGMIHAGDAVVRAFQRQGWGWGGAWSSGQDYQHFSATGT